MATFNISKSAIVKSSNPKLISPTTWYSTRGGLKEQINLAWTNYGTNITTVAENSGILSSILLGFMMIESGGKNKIGKSGLYPGLMKFNRTLVYEKLEKEKNSNRLSASEEKIFNDNSIYFTKKSDGTYKLTGSGLEEGTKTIKTSVMLVPKFNISVSAILIGQYIDAFKTWLGYSEDSEVSVDDALKIIACTAIRYNAGPGPWESWRDRLKKLAWNQIGSKAYAPFLYKESRVYVQKMLGENGCLDIIWNDLGIV